MGEVYRARDTRLGRDVAVKILPAAFAADPERLRRFEQEARAASALNHPNILTVFDIGQERPRPARGWANSCARRHDPVAFDIARGVAIVGSLFPGR